MEENWIGNSLSIHSDGVFTENFLCTTELYTNVTSINTIKGNWNKSL